MQVIFLLLAALFSTSIAIPLPDSRAVQRAPELLRDDKVNQVNPGPHTIDGNNVEPRVVEENIVSRGLFGFASTPKLDVVCDRCEQYEKLAVKTVKHAYKYDKQLHQFNKVRITIQKIGNRPFANGRYHNDSGGCTVLYAID